MTEAIKKLEGSMEHFAIKPVGPLVQSWPEAS